MKLNMYLMCLALIVLTSCSVGIPDGASAIRDFQSEKYLGKWFEIARFDFKFERDLDNVTAEYSKKENGHIKVVNRGFHTIDKVWKQSVGEARFVNDPSEARLKVSFFKPFWAGYNVIDMVDYKYALVAGKNLDYLWILSREKTIPGEVKERFLTHAKRIGYDTSRLIWVNHD